MATLETISLEIKANANGAGKEISALVGNIRSLSKAVTNALSPLTSFKDALNVGNQIQNINSSIKDTGKAATAATQSTRHYSGVLSQIGRIAKMMVIRTAVRALIKGFQQSWQAAYQFSRQMNGSFAKAVDATRTMIADTTTSLIKTFAPVLEAMVPVIYTITQAIQWLCNQIQALLQLLGLTSDMFGASTENINKYYGSTNKASKANKNLLASWDELNVIQSKNSGAGGGGYTPGALKDLVSKEVDGIMQIIVGEAMLGLGLILACTGHFGLGIGMMLVGASAIAKTVTTDWNKLPNNVKKTINTITGVVGVASLALGAIFLCTGHIGMGLGLLAIGALNLGIAYASDDGGENIVNRVKSIIKKVLEIATISLLAIGVIMLCMGNPLGIALIAGGLVAFGASVAMNWDGDLVSSIKTTLGNIKDTFFQVWDSIDSKVTEVWNSITKWWEDSGLGEKVRTAWSGVSTFFQELFGNAEDGTGIIGWATTTWKGLETWWNTNVAEAIEKEGAWGGVKAFFSALFKDIGDGCSLVWEDIKKWWNSTEIGKDINKAWESVSDFFSTLFGGTEVPGSIADYANDAWIAVSTWWDENIYQNVKTAWDSVTTFFSTLFGSGEGSIEDFFNGMWSNVSLLWGDILTNVQNAWGSIGLWFYNNVTVPVSNFFIDCVNGIIDGLNFFVRALNSLSINIPALDFGFLGKTQAVHLGFNIAEIQKMEKLQPVASFADGGYGIPKGDMFIANERGAELVGQMGGKTTVANQQQIIEGISSGVSAANAEQNRLLSQQNDLLRALLDKEWNIEPSAAWGKHNQRSNEMWAMVTGR